MHAHPPNAPITVQIPCPEPLVGPQFDAVHDRSCVDEGLLADLGNFLGRLSTISYSRPDSLVGLPALVALDKWLSHGLELRGGRDEKGFLFLYELMRGDLVFKILSNDSGHALGAILMRMLPPSETQKAGFLMSVLRCLMHNPQIARKLPRWEDDRKVKITNIMFRGQEVLTKLLENVAKVMREHEREGKLTWPQHRFARYAPSNAVEVDPSLRAYLLGDGAAVLVLPTRLRPWLTLRPGELCTSRSVAQTGASLVKQEVVAFASAPLSPIDFSTALVTHTRAQRGMEPLQTRLPFDLSRHPAARTDLAASMLERLHEDMRLHAAAENASSAPMLAGFSRADIASCAGSATTTSRLLAHAEALARADGAQQRDTRASPARRARGRRGDGLPMSAGESAAADASGARPSARAALRARGPVSLTTSSRSSSRRAPRPCSTPASRGRSRSRSS